MLTALSELAHSVCYTPVSSDSYWVNIFVVTTKLYLKKIYISSKLT